LKNCGLDGTVAPAQRAEIFHSGRVTLGDPMDLPTHVVSGLAVGFVLFGRPEIALIIALGALLPDLDREYWFIPQKKYSDEQRHRALFHNVVMLALVYAVSPFLSLGVFIHMLEDSFTTVKDRGVEWFYPFTRLAKRGRYDVNGNPRPLDPDEHVYFYQEDPAGLIRFAEPDLRQTGPDPVPWRRVYGFALNSNLLDRGFLLGSALMILIWLFVPTMSGTFPNLGSILSTPSRVYQVWTIGLIAIGILFLAGELDRKDQKPKLGGLNFLKIPIFVFGLALLAYWVLLNGATFGSNVQSVFTQPLALVAAIVLLPLLAFILIRWKTKRGTSTAII